jgi:hypothetical protein
MAKQTPAQRARKKTEKAQKRKKQLSKRKDVLPPELRWKPLTEGIEGLARRVGVSTFMAGTLASPYLKRLGVTDDAVWSADRMRGQSTGAILDLLETLGVATDAESFANRALDLLSTVQFVERDWLPLLGPDQTVHQRDMLRAANVVLWERWLPDTVHDEEINGTIGLAAVQLDANSTPSPIADLLEIFEALGDDAARRLIRHPNGEEFVRTLLDALWEAYESGQLEDGTIPPEDEEAALAALDLLIPLIVPSLEAELAPLREALAGDPEEDWDDDDDDPEDDVDPDADEPGT